MRKRLLTILMTLAMVMSVTITAYAQKPRQVSGTVENETGEPVIGATVMIVGTSNGVSTDIDGRFILSNVLPSSQLKVSYVGYEPQTIQIGDNDNFKIVLKENSTVLNDVVVVGYGTMRKKDLTGAVTQINPDKFGDENPATVQDLLRGTPGLQIGYDPTANSAPSIKLRGQNSLYTDGDHNAPLIILDGMQFYGSLSEISPDDIAQIDVLKDSSSAAIYGAKAASGVIIITTKKGKEGKPTINLSVNFGVSNKSKYRGTYDADGYIKFREDWYKATTYGYREDGSWGYYGKESGVPDGYYDNYNNLSKYGITQDTWATTGDITLQQGETNQSLYARRLLLNNAAFVYNNYLNGETTDWESLTFRTGLRQDYNASISGATERINYYFSLGFLKNEGVVQGNDYKSFRGKIKLSAKITDWLEIGTNVNFQDRSDGDIQASLSGNYWDGNMLLNSPFASLYTKDGKYEQYPMTGMSSNGGYNYYHYRDFYDLEKGYTVLNTMFNAKVSLPFGITYQLNVAPRYQWFYDRYFMSAELPNSTAANRGVNRGHAKNFDWNLNNTVTWDRTFNDIHRLTVTLVQEAEESKHWSDNILARNILPSDALGFHMTANANKEQSSFNTDDTHWTAAAYLGRVFYGFDDRYMLTATVRRDGYSAFGSSRPWATFWSTGVSWRFSEEKFARFDWLDEGKLRVSYGTNGNRSLANTYLSLANLNSESTMVYVQNGTATPVKTLKMGRLANPNLSWEKTTAWNFGLDFSLFNYRLSGSIDYYAKRTHDMIMGKTLPNFTGFNSITTNLGEVTNSGLEISLSGVPVRTNDFEWKASAGFSYNKNRIKHLYYTYDNNGIEQNDISNNWFIGHPIGEIWTWKVDGIWQAEEADEAAKLNQKPGDPKVIDRDGNGVYNDDDKFYLGTTIPPFYWNMRHDFTLWKDLTFSFSLYSYMGHKTAERYYLNQENNASAVTNCFNVEKKGYWTPDNRSNEYGRLGAVGPAGCTDVAKVYNRNFVRLDNVSIGYTLPKKWTKKAQIEKVRLTVSCNNVCTFSNWEHGDPENGGLGVRTFNFGLNLTL